MSRVYGSRNRVKAFELSILVHIVFLKNLTDIGRGLVEVMDQIERGYSFIADIDLYGFLGYADMSSNVN